MSIHDVESTLNRRFVSKLWELFLDVFDIINLQCIMFMENLFFININAFSCLLIFGKFYSYLDKTLKSSAPIWGKT